MPSEPQILLEHVSGTLTVEVSAAPMRLAKKPANRAARPEAEVVALRFEASIFENGEFRSLTEPELEEIAFAEQAIRLRSGRTTVVIRFDAPNKKHFTVRDLIAAIEVTEQATRPSSDWFGGVDIHHVFFEGIAVGRDGIGSILWGS